MTLVFLGRFRDIAGAITPPAHVTTLAALKDWLAQAHPQLSAALAAVPTQIAVNQAIVRDMATPITANDEIAFLPPMSGG